MEGPEGILIHYPKTWKLDCLKKGWEDIFTFSALPVVLFYFLFIFFETFKYINNLFKSRDNYLYSDKLIVKLL